jgi:hypothetical protein
VKVFLLKAYNNLLPAKENLIKKIKIKEKKIVQETLCPICGLDAETTSHILIRCPSSNDVWGELF